VLTGVLCWRLSQLVGVVCASATSACATYAVLMLIKMTVGVDITWEEEDAGLDKSQIGETGAVGVQLGCSWGAVGGSRTPQLPAWPLRRPGGWRRLAAEHRNSGHSWHTAHCFACCTAVPPPLPSVAPFPAGEIGYDYVSTADDDNLDADDLTQVLFQRLFQRLL
jgi:hypothetical protein